MNYYEKEIQIYILAYLLAGLKFNFKMNNGNDNKKKNKNVLTLFVLGNKHLKCYGSFYSDR